MNKSIRKARNIYFILQTLFYVHLGIIGSTYILYFYNQGLSKLQTNIISSVFSITVFMMEIPSGAYCDRFGSRKTLLCAGITLSLSMLLFWIGGNIAILAIAQLLWGASFAFESGASQAWVINKLQLKKEALDKMFAQSQKINSISMIIGGLIGAYLATKELRYIWILPIFLGLVYILFVSICVYDNKLVKNTKTDFITGISDLKKNTKLGFNTIKKTKPLKKLIIFNLVISFSFSPLFVYWSPYISSLTNEGIWILGWMWVLIKVMNIIGNMVLDKYCFKIDRNRVLVSSLLILSCVVTTAGMSDNFIYVVCMFLLFELLLGIIKPIQRAYINEYIVDDIRATLVSFDSMFGRIGSFLSLIIMGYLGDMFSMGLTWMIAGLLSLLSIKLVLDLRKITN